MEELKSTLQPTGGFSLLKISAIWILLACLMTSCRINQHAMDLSIEFNRQQYIRKGLPPPSRNKPSYGLNYTLFMLEKIDKLLYDKDPGEGSFLFHPDPTMTGFKELSGTASKPASSPHPNFPDNLYLMAGPSLVSKRSDDGGEKITLNYFAIPSYVILMRPLPTGKIWGGLGPYVAYGLGGKTKDTFSGEKYKSFNKDDGFRRFDAGLGFTAWYEFNNQLSIRLGYEVGLLNIGHEENEAVHNRTISLHMMYPVSKIKTALQH